VPFYVAVEEPDALGGMSVGERVGSCRDNVVMGMLGLVRGSECLPGLSDRKRKTMCPFGRTRTVSRRMGVEGGVVVLVGS